MSLSNLPAADRVSVSSKQKKSPYYNTPDNTPPSKLVKNPVLKQGYDTLDSAYSTSESSYNTVDSSYLQQSVSSGYSTLESKWKEPKLSHPPGDKSSLASSVLLKPAVGYQQDIRFVDEIESSDTATETETDTEGTIGANTLDMSYVPDYIRPVTSALNSHSEDLLTITLSSSSKSIPTASVSTLKDENLVVSSRVSSYGRPGRTATRTGSREDYMRKQKDKLCGRKSLGDRLRSLETDASVKLQVCRGSQNRRKKSLERENKDCGEVSVQNSNVKGDHHNRSENYDKEDLQVDATPTRAPPPDIIESHQPPSCNAKDSLRKDDINIPLSDISRFSTDIKESVSINLTEDAPEKKSVPEVQRNTFYNQSNASSGSYIASQQPEAAESVDEKTAEAGDITGSGPLFPPSQKITKLTWKQPSQEALNKLHSSITPSNQGATLSADEVESEKISSRIPQKGGGPPLMVDVATDDSVVPVELRSPRQEGDTRSRLKEKRNARVFVFPSSDSESDNLKKSIDKSHINVVPAKFVPSVLKRNQVKPSAVSIDQQPTVSSTSVATIDKEATTDDRPDRTRRSDQRSSSVQRSNSKRTTSKPAYDQHYDGTFPTNSQSTIHVPTCGASRLRSSESTMRTSSEKPHRTPSRNRRSNAEYKELSDVKSSSPRRANKLVEASLPSPRQQAVAHAVKFGLTGNDGEIPYIDDATSPEEQRKPPPSPADLRERSSSDGALLREADSSTLRRAFPLSRRGRTSKRNDVPRRISYMEAMESSEDLTPDPDSDGMVHGSIRSETGREESALKGKLGRSTSADSILSTTENTATVVMRRHNRAQSEDRNSLKQSHRRSYQIATNKSETVSTRHQTHKRRPSIRRLKSYFENNQPTSETQGTEGRRGSRGRSLDPLPTLILTASDGDRVREGFLFFKVSTIEKGKRTSSQKLWKLVWVVLKSQLLYLCKDWTRNKTDSTNDGAVTLSIPFSGQTLPTPPNQLILEEEDPLNIQASLVSIAYNYLKRKNVFKLTTANGSEYLFQAESRDDMLAWINSIQTRGNHSDKGGEATINKDLILKKSSQIEFGPKPEKRNTRKSRSPKPPRRPGVPIKDVDGSRRFKWRGSVNRIVKKFGQGQTLIPGGTFDVHLEDCPASSNNELVPFVVDLCCRIVEEHGLNFTGIYRVPGNSGTLTSLQEDLNTRGTELDVENDPRLRELNVVSSLLKSFFRKLPDPLFTNELYEDFICMNRKKDSEERLNGLRRLIHMLPAPHYETLKFLIAHLRKVADHSEINKMEIRNLAIVFGPTLVRSTISDNMATMVTDMSDQCRIVESVLQHANWFFSRENQESGDKHQPVPKEENHEPVPNIDHLLANVGRTPGDASDNTSESSRSKVSNVSEKDSFSRDVIDMIFGTKKRLLHNPHRNAKEDSADTSDDEYGFKEAERRARASTEPPKSFTKSPPSPKATTQPYKVAPPVATDVRANWHNKSRLAPACNIAASLYDYYVENVNKFNRNDVTRPPYQQASSTESSPPITIRSSAPNPPVQRTYAMQLRHSAQPPLQSNGWKVTPPQPRFFKNESPPLKTSEDLQPTSAQSIPSSEPQEKEDSDSDTSIYVGDTLEEKLKNLTNLDKKLERRPSRRRGNPPEFLVKVASEAPPKPANKKLTAPSQLAGEPITPDNLHMYVGKKSTRELYRERKAQRQHIREVIRARRSDNSAARCTSEENLFNRADPKRQIVRSTAHDDSYRRVQQSGEKVRRRHTLGGADFANHEVHDEHLYNSMQNVSCEDPASAMARLRPQLGASAPLLQAVSNSHIFSTLNRQERKAESYL